MNIKKIIESIALITVIAIWCLWLFGAFLVSHDHFGAAWASAIIGAFLILKIAYNRYHTL